MMKNYVSWKKTKKMKKSKPFCNRSTNYIKLQKWREKRTQLRYFIFNKFWYLQTVWLFESIPINSGIIFHYVAFLCRSFTTGSKFHKMARENNLIIYDGIQETNCSSLLYYEAKCLLCDYLSDKATRRGTESLEWYKQSRR